jgi:nicotinate-nucleotide adenylyltransferase
MRIGLLGGTFNPAHAGHREISLTALKRLDLDQVWWLVTPGNPLKDVSGLPSLAKRVAASREVARHPRIEVTGFDGGSRSPYTIELIKKLKRRFPAVNFVWLMGADNLAEFDRWRAWPDIFALMPIAVLDRPGFRLKARASKAAQRFSAFYVDESDAAGLPFLIPPAWTIVSHRLSGLSSTELRAKKEKAKKEKAKKEKAKKKLGGKAKSSVKPKAKEGKKQKRADARGKSSAKLKPGERQKKKAGGKAKLSKKKAR